MYAAAVTQNMQTNPAEKPVLRQIIRSRISNIKEPLFTSEAIIACCKRSARFLNEIQTLTRLQDNYGNLAIKQEANPMDYRMDPVMI